MSAFQIIKKALTKTSTLVHSVQGAVISLTMNTGASDLAIGGVLHQIITQKTTSKSVF